MEGHALGLRLVGEGDGVVGVFDGAEEVGGAAAGPGGRGITGDDAGMQLGELVDAPADADEDGGVLPLEGGVEQPLQAGAPVLEGRTQDGRRHPMISPSSAAAPHP